MYFLMPCEVVRLRCDDLRDVEYFFVGEREKISNGWCFFFRILVLRNEIPIRE